MVSHDSDLRLACNRFPNLLYFESLPRLTELLLSEDDRVSRLRASIEKGITALESAVGGEMDGMSFYHTDRRFELHDTTLGSPSLVDISVVAIGDNECTITFIVEFEAEFELRWEDWGHPDAGGTESF